MNIIRTSAFSDCSALTTIAIPDSVQTIESTAFYKCSALKEIQIGKGVSRIEARAFFGCTGLEDVYYAGSEPRWNDIYKGSDNTPLYTATVHFAEDPVEDPTAPPAMSNPFKDVKETDYFYAPVLWAVEKGITNGTSPTTFAPETTCTRGQVVTFLWRAAGSPEPTTTNPFSDIREKDYFYKAVLWAVEKGITTALG